jgi:HK97 gp10 family phage protein
MLIPEIDKPANAQTAYVAVGANYAIYPEFGTIHQPPQPAFIPAVEEARQGFEDAMAALETKLKEATGL